MSKFKPAVQELIGEVPVILTDTVTNQIKQLTSAIHNVEWSGVLFYSIKGDINTPKTFSVQLEYIYLMDKGTGGATHYELNEELIEFKMSNPESLSWRMGHIHSHHNMDAYFSGVDMDEITENSEFHNYYLSIIVNNALKVVGKIAFRGILDNTTSYKCVNSEGDSYNLKIKEEKIIVFTYNCAIPKLEYPVSINFKERIANIIAAANIKKAAMTKALTTMPKKQNGNPFDELKHSHNPLAMHNQFDMGFNDDILDDFEWEDDFPSYWLSFGQLGSENDTPEEAIEKVAKYITKTMTLQKYTTALLDETLNLYEGYFSNVPDVTLIEALMGILDVFEEYVVKYPFLDIILTHLEMYIKELENKEQLINNINQD